MSDHKDRLADYIEVPDRIRQFKAEHPDGSLQGAWRWEQVGDRAFIVYTALAFRTPDDERPGEGNAWEPFPGKTPYTKDSELMNAETSAWGRALAALGFVGKKIATADEVRARQANGDSPDMSARVAPSEKQVDFLVALAKQHGADPSEQESVRAYALEVMSGGKNGTVSQTINNLKDGDDPDGSCNRLVAAALKWDAANHLEIPADTEGLGV